MIRPAFVITAVFFAATAALLAAFMGGNRGFFIPAPLFSAHDRFTEGCVKCHAPWSGPSQMLCMDCHGRALATDTHPASKLASPVKAKVPQDMSGLTCVNCHREHGPSSAGGYTGPQDFCQSCHLPETLDADHRDFTAQSCRTPSCHSYHANITRAQYATAYQNRMKPASETLKKHAPPEKEIITPEEIGKMRAALFYRDNPVISARYEIGAHSGTKATCVFCHGRGAKTANLKPGVNVCADCHKTQVTTFIKGRHGATDGVNGGWLYGATPKMGCGACHDAHSLRLENAGKAACLACHKDSHAVSHTKSGHNRYLTDPVFENKPMTGADCAACHMPRLAGLGGHTDHNETLSSSSKERMAMTVCSLCHGLRFALMALHDVETVRSNFTTAPQKTPVGVEYLDKVGKTIQASVQAPVKRPPFSSLSKRDTAR